MKAKISEIFRSIQGEGKLVGINQVFVRFYDCNISCDWCDTRQQMIDQGEPLLLNEEDVFSEVSKLWSECHSVVLTGGEPLMQSDFISGLLPLFKQSGMPVYLETNGILHRELEGLVDFVDFVAMDIKLPSSTGCDAFWDEHEKFLKISSRKDVFVKMVITNDTAKADIERAVALIVSIDSDIVLVLQPNSNELRSGVATKCIEFQQYCLNFINDVRVIPQMHKFLGIK